MIETDRGRGTHKLETAEEETCHDTKTNRPTKGHSPTGDSRRRDLSGRKGNRPSEGHSRSENSRGGDLSEHDGTRPSEGHSPTGDGRERLVRIQKEIDPARVTHYLKTQGGTC